MATQGKAPGLRFRNGRAMWRASKAAITAGYPVKSVNLAFLEPDMVDTRCRRLQAEMLAWLSGRTNAVPAFNGTIASLLDVYQRDPESPYRNLKASSRHPYEVYARLLRLEVGARRIDACDGRDLRRWFASWSEPAKEGGKRRIAAARMAITVLKAALSFGKTCRMRGCAEFKSILEEIAWEAPRPRTEAPTAAQVTAARMEAHKAGHPLAALGYALQFEAPLRQWDVIGEWVALDDKRPSAVLAGGRKWIGPSWSQIDDNLILRSTPTKTEGTTEARVTFDLRACPMVLEEMERVPIEQRSGPIIVNPTTGLPYQHHAWRELWRANATAAGIPSSVWNRDLRAGGNTEGQQSGARLEDRKKVMGHSATSPVTAAVYDRDVLEAHRRVARARTDYRAKTKP